MIGLFEGAGDLPNLEVLRFGISPIWDSLQFGGKGTRGVSLCRFFLVFLRGVLVGIAFFFVRKRERSSLLRERDGSMLAVQALRIDRKATDESFRGRGGKREKGI